MEPATATWGDKRSPFARLSLDPYSRAHLRFFHPGHGAWSILLVIDRSQCAHLARHRIQGFPYIPFRTFPSSNYQLPGIVMGA